MSSPLTKMDTLQVLRISSYVATLVAFCTIIIRAELTDYARHENALILHFGRFKYRFLTTWNFIILSGHALLALTCEYLIIRSSETKVPYLKQLLSLRDAIFTAVVLPITVLVVTVFWGLYWIDRNLIFPEFMELVLPPFDNHAVHTAVLPLVILEMLLQPREKPSSHLLNMIFTTGFFVLYGIPFFGTYFVHGQYLYPFVEQLSPLSFVVFCFVLWMYTLALCRVQWPLVSWRWPDKGFGVVEANNIGKVK